MNSIPKRCRRPNAFCVIVSHVAKTACGTAWPHLRRTNICLLVIEQQRRSSGSKANGMNEEFTGSLADSDAQFRPKSISNSQNQREKPGKIKASCGETLSIKWSFFATKFTIDARRITRQSGYWCRCFPADPRSLDLVDVLWEMWQRLNNLFSSRVPTYFKYWHNEVTNGCQCGSSGKASDMNLALNVRAMHQNDPSALMCWINFSLLERHRLTSISHPAIMKAVSKTLGFPGG